jgi:serine/threonine protein kinase
LIPRLPEAFGLDRRNLAKRTQAVLNHGGWGNPDVLLVETELGSVVVKDYSQRTHSVRRWLGPWLLRREARAYRRLEGLEAVPRLLGQLDTAALVIEYRPGVLLSRSLAGQLPGTFLVELQGAITEMHRRGVVHLDLRHRSNILASPDGRPVLIDFASALRFDSSTRSGRVGVLLLGWLDRRALKKWQVRLAC